MRGRYLVILAVAVLAGCSSGGDRKAATHDAAAPPSSPAVAASDSPSARASLRRLLAEHLPIYCGGDRQYAALTFDDGPGVYTPLALRLLAKAHVPATFFLVGRNVGPYSRLAKAEARRYALGNHTFTHPLLPALGPAAIDTQLTSTSAVIRRYTGVRVQLFRPPYEARNSRSTRPPTARGCSRFSGTSTAATRRVRTTRRSRATSRPA